MTETTRGPTAVGTNAWTNPTNAYTDNDTYATAPSAGKNTSVQGIWTTFGFTDPGGATSITKVEIGTQHFLSTISSIICTMGREISWDGGSSWGSHELTNGYAEIDTETEYWVDVTADTEWTWTKLNDTNLQVRISNNQGNDSTTYTMSLDVVYVRVTYSTVTPTEVYAAEAILSYEVPPCEIYAAEAILSYVASAEVYATEVVLDYNVPPCEVYAAEVILDYIQPCEAYASEVILDYEVPPCEAYAAEVILDYAVYENTPTEAYAAEAILDYNPVVACEVYATEAILDYELSGPTECEVYAAEVILNYYTPDEIGWWGWYAFQFVVHPIRRLRAFHHFRGKQNLEGIPDEEKLRERE